VSNFRYHTDISLEGLTETPEEIKSAPREQKADALNTYWRMVAASLKASLRIHNTAKFFEPVSSYTVV
jgi:hypothetical protein